MTDQYELPFKRGRVLASITIAAVLVLAPQAAKALGKITTVTVNPNSAPVGQSVGISIKGVGFCESLQVLYGDGQKTVHSINFLGGKSLDLTHTYAAPGTKNILAQGTKACVGGASAQVQINAKPGGNNRDNNADPSKNEGRFVPMAGDDRRGRSPADKKAQRGATETKFSVEKKNNDLMKFLRPKIQAISSQPGPHVRPGADLHITGIAFGDQKGSVYIHGTFNNSPRKVSTIKSWTDTKIVAQVPPNWGGAIGGVCGWTIEVEVRSAKNVASHKAGMVWAAQHRELSWKDPAVTVTQCGYDGNIDMCNGNRQLQGCFITTFSHDGKADPKLTLHGLHFNCAATTEDDTGTDKYAINLPPGWKFDKLTVKKKKTSGPGDADNKITGPSPAFPVGKTTWNPSFAWGVTSDDWVAYEYRVRAKAPETCPW